MQKSSALAIALYTVFLAVFLYSSASRSLAPYTAILDLVFVTIAAFSFWAVASVASRESDSIWYRISVGFFIWCLTILLRLIEMALNQPDYGTLADCFWIAGYFPLISGSYLWFRKANPNAQIRRLILVVFACIAAVVLFAFEWPLLLNPSRPVILKMLDLVYAAFDLLMAGFLAGVALTENSRGSRLLVFALLILLGSDIVFSYYGEAVNSLVFRYLDVPYTTGYFLIALAGCKQREASEGSTALRPETSGAE